MAGPAVEAMGLMLTAPADVLVIASSDRDFLHLATHLREKGVRVIGNGDPKDIIRSDGTVRGYQIARLGGRMHALYKMKISHLPEKTWRVYLLARPALFDCDPKGPESCVRLKT